MHQSGTIHLGHPSIRKPPVRSRGNSKLLGRITVIVFNVPFPLHLPFSKIFKKKSVEPRHWQVTIQFIKFEHVPIYLELSFILFCIISSIFDGNIWSKNFQNTKTFFLHLLKSVNNKHTFFELTSSWSVHPHSPRERLHSGRETWLGTVERTSALSKMQSWSRNTKRKIKKLAKLKAWKGDLGNRERPGGLKTRKGSPGKNKGHKKKHTPGGLKTRKGDPGKS